MAEIPQELNHSDWQDNWQQAVYWLYQSEQDFSPIASYQQGELFYTVTDHIGTITELVSERGHIEYQQHLSLWGEADFRLNRSLQVKNQEPLTCRLRFAGQYADDESGLYYNRHRYYNPAVGQYISPDPIGLLGGFNPYGYVGLPTEWVDPLGLKGCWSAARSKYWKNEAKINSHKYSQRNLAEMAKGKAPKIEVEMFNPRTMQNEIVDVSMELHHKYLPQRAGTPKAHEFWNLEPATPWSHEKMDPFRHTGTELIKIIKGVNSW